MNLVNRVSDGGSGRASGSSDGDIGGLNKAFERQTNRVNAVSYTHLDVYKRQVLNP